MASLQCETNLSAHISQLELNKLISSQWSLCQTIIRSWIQAQCLPNCFLSSVYCLATSIHVRAAPRVPQAIPNRALLRQLNGPFRPLTFGNIFALGTFTSSMAI